MVAARFWRRMAVVPMLLVATGCGPRLPATAPVSGMITLAGKPLAGAAVSFVNDTAPRFAIGRTDSSGRYSLTTFSSGDGAVLGDYRVVVLASPRAEQGGSQDEKALPTVDDYRRLEKTKKSSGAVPEPYRSADKTPLRAQVKPGNNQLDFDLKAD